jgi:hypothetical protein
MRPWVAILIALAALLFTIFSFWWMNWRVGSLQVTVPSTYGASSSSGRLTMLLPLVFFNTGPVPYVVRNLRLRFADEPNGVPLDFHLIRSGVSPSHHPEPVDLAAPFPVPGNETLRLFCEFIRKPGGRTVTAATYTLVLEGLTDKRGGWHPLLEFPLYVDARAERQIPGAFLAYENRLSE